MYRMHPTKHICTGYESIGGLEGVAKTRMHKLKERCGSRAAVLGSTLQDPAPSRALEPILVDDFAAKRCGIRDSASCNVI